MFLVKSFCYHRFNISKSKDIPHSSKLLANFILNFDKNCGLVELLLNQTTCVLLIFVVSQEHL